MLVDEIQEEESTARGDYYTLALFHTDGDGGDAVGIEFQRGVGGIYGDPASGTPPYCLVTSDQRTFYGGVDKVVWRDSAVDIDISEEARAALRLPDRQLAIDLELDSGDVAKVKSGLQRIFAAHDPGAAEPELTGF
jgi:hypothetical protein